MFPIIHSLHDVLPSLEHKPEFFVKHYDSYITVSYHYQKSDTFSSPILLECRGIKFNSHDCSILARPLHKFFNLGEVPSNASNLDFSQCTVTEKLDGCLIHSAFLDGKPRLMSKAGITSFSIQAEKLLSPSLSLFLSLMEKKSLTPIFEFVGFHHGVISYPHPQLFLLAIRHKITGNYLSFDQLQFYSYIHHLSLPPSFSNDHLHSVKYWTSSEGVVLSWNNNFFLKLKSDDFVLKHKCKSSISQETDLISLIISDSLDDIIPLLSPLEQNSVLSYRDSFIKTKEHVLSTLSHFYYHIDFQSSSRKDIALKLQSTFSSSFQSIFWMVYSKGITHESAFDSFLKKKLGSSKSLESARDILPSPFTLKQNYD